MIRRKSLISLSPTTGETTSSKQRRENIGKDKDDQANKKMEQEEEKWVDDLINMFIAPNAKRHIDNEKGLLSNQSST